MNNEQRTLIYEAIIDHKDCCRSGDVANATNNATTLFNKLLKMDTKLTGMTIVQRKLFYNHIKDHMEYCQDSDIDAATNGATRLFNKLLKIDSKLKAMVDAYYEQDADIEVLKAKREQEAHFGFRCLGD